MPSGLISRYFGVSLQLFSGDLNYFQANLELLKSYFLVCYILSIVCKSYHRLKRPRNIGDECNLYSIIVVLIFSSTLESSSVSAILSHSLTYLLTNSDRFLLNSVC